MRIVVFVTDDAEIQLLGSWCVPLRGLITSIITHRSLARWSMMMLRKALITDNIVPHPSCRHLAFFLSALPCRFNVFSQLAGFDIGFVVHYIESLSVLKSHVVCFLDSSFGHLLLFF